MYIHQDEHYVWLAFDYPAGSYGILDMELVSSKQANPLNLHISAQLGEWLVSDTINRPKTPESDLWWQTSGWTANALWFNGNTADPNGNAEPKFKASPARELQLSKARFGRGLWQFSIRLNGLIDTTGVFYSVRFPEGNERYYHVDVE